MILPLNVRTDTYLLGDNCNVTANDNSVSYKQFYEFNIYVLSAWFNVPVQY